jgi:SAM-dependent methyltransferase
VAFSDLFKRRNKDDAHEADVPVAQSGPLHPSKALPKFLHTLSGLQQPMLLDLGPVVGSNVTFFGEQLGCKIFVENIYRDIDHHVREGKEAELAAFFATRFPQEDGSVDGVLCWDLIDYLEKPAAQALARQIVRILRPGGVLFTLFATTTLPSTAPAEYTRYLVADESNLVYRPYAAARSRQRPWMNRDSERMFEGLRVAEQFLLKTNLREVLFRKPGEAAEQPAAASSTPPR